MLDLPNLQQWMQGRLLDGLTVHADEHVVCDARLAATARLEIYVHAYRQRLVECLRNEYPLLLALAGPTVFELFAQGYIAAKPSRSYTLYEFGAGFADYLEAARPLGDGTPQTVEAIPAALARIERAKAEVSRARGWERDAALLDESGLHPMLDAAFGLHLGRMYRRPDSVRLLSLPFDFTGTLNATTRPPPLPEPAPWFAAVARVNYRVQCHGLEDWQHAWLSTVPEGDVSAIPPTDARLANWLPVAVGRGLVVAVG